MPGYHNKFRVAAPPPVRTEVQDGPLSAVGNFAVNRGLDMALDAYAPGAGTFGGDLARSVAPQFVPRFALGGPAMNPAQDPSRAIGDALAAQGGAMRLNHGGMVDPTEAARVMKDMIAGGMSPSQAQYMIDRVNYFKGLSGGATHKANGGPIGGGQSKEALKEARSLGALTQAEFLKAMAHGNHLARGGKPNCGPLASVQYKNEGGEVWTRNYHDPNKAAPKPAGDK